MRALVLLLLAAVAAAAQPAPLLVWLTSENQKAFEAPGWDVLPVAGITPDDSGLKRLEAALAGRQADPARVYLGGSGATSASVFYAISRRPGLWAAAFAAGGSPKPAIETNRLFGANAQLVPMLWVTAPADREALEYRQQLRKAGFLLEPPVAEMPLTGVIEWLGTHRRDEYPLKADLETGNLEYARAWWVEIVKLDPAQRNDVLPSSRVAPQAASVLALGGYGFKDNPAGPGLLISWLPPDYQGPLRLGDAMVSIAGKEVRGSREYFDLMARLKQDQRVGIVLLRGKERIRIEASVIAPRLEETATARVSAEFLLDARELLVISRGAGEIRLRLPEHWAPCPVNWNGVDAGRADSAGCWSLAGGRLSRCLP
jgi:hypothetical protein